MRRGSDGVRQKQRVRETGNDLYTFYGSTLNWRTLGEFHSHLAHPGAVSDLN